MNHDNMSEPLEPGKYRILAQASAVETHVETTTTMSAAVVLIINTSIYSNYNQWYIRYWILIPWFFLSWTTHFKDYWHLSKYFFNIIASNKKTKKYSSLCVIIGILIFTQMSGEGVPIPKCRCTTPIIR